MALRRFKAITPAQRFKVTSDFAEITKDYPEKNLTAPLRKAGGRNSTGRLTCRHRGGGHKRRYRIIDFKRDKFDMPAEVKAIEYDPNRTSRIALLEYEDKERRYIIYPANLAVGERVISSSDSQVDIKPGNAMKLEHIPLGTVVHNIELIPGKGAQMIRSAGSWGQLMAKDKGMAHLRLPSGEMRMVFLRCRATVGQIGFIEHSSEVDGKAGRNRWRGIRPTVRGSAMNPVDHPHGGGEGKAGQGNPHPVSPWGKPAKGGKTRKRKKQSNRLIIKRRK